MFASKSWCPGISLVIALIVSVTFCSLAYSSENRKENAQVWFEGNEIIVEWLTSENKLLVKWNFDIYPSGDLRIQGNAYQDGQLTPMDMIVLQGELLFVNGVELEPMFAIDSLDLPSLMLQLVLKILANAIPDGPEGIEDIKNIDFTDNKNPLHVATQSASGAYGPPWEAKGVVKKIQQGIISYDLTFSYKRDGNDEKFNEYILKGSWQFKKSKQALDYDLNVEDYDVFSLGVREMQTQKGGTVDYGTEKRNSYTTLNDALKNINKSFGDMHKGSSR